MRAIGRAHVDLCPPVARPLVRDRSAKVIGGAPCRSRLGGTALGCLKFATAAVSIARLAARSLAYPQSPGHGQRADWLGIGADHPRTCISGSGRTARGSPVVGIRRSAQRRIPGHPSRNMRTSAAAHAASEHGADR